MSTTKLRGSAHDRLLAAANELFYAEGVHTVGIERVIERAGVAKASLYSAFGSKDELVRAYLQGRAESRQRRIAERLALTEDPRERILGVFDLLGELAASPAFRGCAFLNATAEGGKEDGPRGSSKVSRICADQRAWTVGLFTELARDAGARDPGRLAEQLMILYDGTTVGGSMDGGPAASRTARAMAEVLLDAQAPASRRGKRTARK
ncbi:MAG TPA: helix-turn-helix domain-containing protein [Polyangia bacterium]|nr:helix-turn-helix domain-containing protein [Polyangia bacterium]